MSIVSSTFEYVEPNAATDKPRWVREIHAFSTGEKHISTYLAVPGTDCQAIANSRAASVAEDAANREATEIVGA